MSVTPFARLLAVDRIISVEEPAVQSAPVRSVTPVLLWALAIVVVWIGVTFAEPLIVAIGVITAVLDLGVIILAHVTDAATNADRAPVGTRWVGRRER